MSKFQGEFVIVSIDLRIILSNYVATDVYALFRKSIKKTTDLENEGIPNDNMNQVLVYHTSFLNAFIGSEYFASIENTNVIHFPIFDLFRLVDEVC